MKTLAPNLFQRRFQDLVEIGRARLPFLAPEWTDHNAHDPGITLMELLAWVAEAQLYSLSRVRRDERLAYAALLGISPHGTQGASGMIWSDRLAPNSPVSTYMKSLVLPEETVVNVIGGESSTFRPTHRLLWAPGRITKLETQDAKGRTTDHTITNERGGLPFLPFGERGGRHSVLALTFECRDKAGLLGNDPQSARGAFWPIGVLVAPTPGAQAPEPSGQTDCSPITAAVVIGQKRTRLRIESDTTRGLLTTGTLFLDLSDIKTSPERLTIELGLPNGFSRPPRLLRIEPNVIPIRQVQTIEHEEETANGLPDWTFSIGVQPLLFASGAEPITLKVAESSDVKIWQRRDRISEDGPDDNVYEFDAESGQITFGNGINGRIPPAGSKVAVTFEVSDGEEGRVARNRKWSVAGFADTFGVNLDPIGGGIAASGFIGDRREARLRSREDHSLISSADIAAAAKSLPLLEVARAWVPASPNNAPRTGVVTLVVMRSRLTTSAGAEPPLPPETAQWLKAISRLLSPRMPLGSRLSVVAPRYLEFTIDAVLEADPSRKPSAIEEEIEKELKKRLALVESPGVRPRQAGVPVTSRDVAAWMRAINGVRRVIQLELRYPDGQVTDQVAVPRNGLPRWVAGSGNKIEVKRPEPGRSR